MTIKNFKRNYQLPSPNFDINDRIRAEKLRVIDDEGENLGVISKSEALQLAQDKQLDLVLISPNEDIPVAKIVDWSKFKYLQSKKSKNKSKSVTIKEWWFSPKIEEKDIDNKLKNIEKFLKKGGKVKVTVRFARRSNPEDMYTVLNRVIEKSAAFAEKASDINREGRNLSIFLKNLK